MDWYPQPMFTAEQAAANTLFVFEKRRIFLEKVRFRVLKPCLRLNRRPQALFLSLSKYATFCFKRCVLVKPSRVYG